ncbi:RHH/CopG DNA binding protein [Halomicrobium sp. LC1Hm]|nr:RHH/CopG DNA binding protein [Halomicrobium sp. LC1Hm]
MGLAARTLSVRMRPKIPDSLARRVEAVCEDGGYATASELIRDATRERVAELEAQEVAEA